MTDLRLPKVMGILNATPDSFFAGGRTPSLAAALKRAEAMLSEGADLLDVGGESTRPGALEVPLEEELKRVIPLVKQLAKRFPRARVSVDTRKAEVARRALEEGAALVNDVSAGLADPAMGSVLARFKPGLVLMHMRGTPPTMQRRPRYQDPVAQIKLFLASRIRWARGLGLHPKKIWIDPGFGFGKTLRHNLEILARLKEFLSLGCPVLVGCSRKSFVGHISGPGREPLPAEERLEGSLAAAGWAYLQGAAVLRVHDVGATLRTLRALAAIRREA